MKRTISAALILIMTAFLVINGIKVLKDSDNPGKETFVVNDVEEEPTRILFMSSWAGVDSKSVIIEALIQEFNEAHPDIEVVDMSLAGEDFLYTLKTGFASNEPPDVFGLWPGSDLNHLIERGMVADLRHIFDADPEWSSRFETQARKHFMNDKTLYSIPFEMIYEGLFINYDIFSRYKVEIPQTIEDLYIAIRGLRNRGIVPIAFNGTPEGSFLLQNLMVSSQGQFDRTQNSPDSLQMKLGAGASDAVAVVLKLQRLGAFPEDYAVMDDYTRNQLFKNKKAAMIFQGSWFPDGAMSQCDDILFIPPPRFERQDPVRLIYGIGNGNFHLSQKVYDDPVRRDAAITFLKFLTSKQSAEAFSVLPGFTSSLAINTSNLSDLGKAGIGTVRSADEVSVPVDHVVDRQVWEEVFIGQLLKVMEGSMTKEALVEESFGYTDKSQSTEDDENGDGEED